MKTTFICFSNSKKYGERCISGIAVGKSDSGHVSFLKDNNRPKWIRPITNEQHGEIPAKLVKDIKILDIVGLEITQNCPNGYQSENVFFKPKSLKIVSSIKPSRNNLNKLIDGSHTTLFGNTSKAVSVEQINELNYSLIFIKPQSFEVHENCYAFVRRARGRFQYNGVHYDLPITDVSFLQTLINGVPSFSQDNVYLTISLGIEFEGWHYKLIAGVVFATE